MSLTLTYRDKLSDPRWQRRRLEVFSRDGFACLCCGAKDKPLHAHHTFYEFGLDPWDYEAGDLLTLCKDCHQEVELTVIQCRGNLKMIRLLRVLKIALDKSGWQTTEHGLRLLAGGNLPLAQKIQDLKDYWMRYHPPYDQGRLLEYEI